MPKPLRFSIVAVFVFSTVAQAAAIEPPPADQCVLVPNRPATVRWKAGPAKPGETAAYSVSDYTGKAVVSGQATTSADGAVEVPLKLGQGYYEIELPAAQQRLGLIVLPEPGRPFDPFFAIDSAMSWLVRDAATREGMIRALARCGVGMSRERLSWGGIQTGPDKWDWETGARFGTLRETCARHRVEVIEMFHDAPGWGDRIGKYPGDVAMAARAWRQIARRWHSTWGALEVWNEPDIAFGGLLPADQYVPLVKTIAWAFAQEKVRAPLVGGVFAVYNRPFLDTAADNGLLDCVDAVSFHTYDRAAAMESLVGRYRDWLAAHHRETMPLWITECGRPWSRGPQRPPITQDAVSALDIVMKGVEARACGIARYFPFVYPYYEEKQNNFGMMDKQATPLRSMAGYARLVGVLGGTRYLGDLACTDPAIQRARVFGDGRRTLAVIYTGRPDPAAKVAIGLKVARAEGLDGRTLPAAQDGTLPIPDGLAYVWLDRDQLGNRLKSATPAMRLWELGQQGTRPRPGPGPIVLRFQFDRDLLTASPTGYRLPAEVPEKLPLAIRAFNLSDQPRSLTLKCATSQGTAGLAGSDTQTISAPPQGSADVAWTLDPRAALGTDDRVTVTISAAGTEPDPIAPLVFELAGEPELARVLKGYPGHVRLPIEEPGRWKAVIAGGGRVTVGPTPEGHCRLSATFGPGDRWVYPQFTLPDSLGLPVLGDCPNFRGNAAKMGLSPSALHAAGIVLRARCQRPATVRMFLWEGDTGVGYLTPSGIIPADGRWHTAVVRFRDLAGSGANAPDPNGRLDLETVRRISIGMNSQAAENCLDFTDVYVLKAK